MAETAEIFARLEREFGQLSLDTEQRSDSLSLDVGLNPESIAGDKKLSLDTVNAVDTVGSVNAFTADTKALEKSDFKLVAEMPPEEYILALNEQLNHLSFDEESQSHDTFSPPHPSHFPFKEEYLPFIVDEINKRKAIISVSFSPYPDINSGTDTPFCALTDSGAMYLAKHLSDRITSLNFYKTSIRDKSLKALSKRKTLQSLFIGDTAITDECIKELIHCKALRVLDISYCPKITPQCGIYLVKCKKLTSLSMYNGFSSTTDDFSSTIGDVKKEADLNELFIRNLAWSTSLTEIKFQQTVVSDELAASLSNMPNLISVNLAHANISEQAKERLQGTTERRINEKLAEPAQIISALLGTKVGAGANSPILNAFAKNVGYDKKLWGVIIDFMRSKAPPKELHCKFSLIE